MAQTFACLVVSLRSFELLGVRVADLGIAEGSRMAVLTASKLKAFHFSRHFDGKFPLDEKETENYEPRRPVDFLGFSSEPLIITIHNSDHFSE